MRTLLRFIALGTIILWTGHNAVRLKRQTLPSNHVQVHSLNSNVSVGEIVVVNSSDSRIELTETRLNLSTWASSSNVYFDTFDTFVNYSATNTESFATFQSARLHTQAALSQYSMKTNRTSNGHSKITNALTGRVNVSVADAGMQVQAVLGKFADLVAHTRTNQAVNKSINIHSGKPNGGGYDRSLVITAEDKTYDLVATLQGAQVRTTYGDVIVDLDNDYRRAVIYTNSHTIELRTALSPFDINMNGNRMLIKAPDEKTVATINKNSSDVRMDVGQLSLLRIDRAGGNFQLGGNPAAADKINVTSMGLTMTLFETKEMIATTNQSHISMITNSTTASFTSSLHNLRVTGGVPTMRLDTGNLTVRMSTNPTTPVPPTLFPGFSPPPDKFATVGPPPFPGQGGRTTASRGPGIGTEATEDGTEITEPVTATPEEDSTIPLRTTSLSGGETGEVETTVEGGITVATVNTQGGERPSDHTSSPVETTEASIGETTSPMEVTASQSSPDFTTALPDITAEVSTDVMTAGPGAESEGSSAPAEATTPESQFTSASSIDDTTQSEPSSEMVVTPDSTLAPLITTEGIPSDFPTVPTLEIGESTSPSPQGGDATTREEIPSDFPTVPTLDTGEVTSPATQGGEASATTQQIPSDFPTGPTLDIGEMTSPATPGGDGSSNQPTATSQQIPSDFPTVPTLDIGEATTPQTSNTDEGAVTQSTFGEWPSPPPTLLPEVSSSTTDFIIGQYDTTVFEPGHSMGIFATLSNVEIPGVAPTVLVAHQNVEEGVTVSEAWTGGSGTLPRSSTNRREAFRLRMRVPEQVDIDDENFRWNLTSSVARIANQTIESSEPVSERRRRNIPVDPIVLNVLLPHSPSLSLDQMTDAGRSEKTDEAIVDFVVDLHEFDDFNHLLTILKAKIQNLTEHRLVVIERLELRPSEGSMEAWTLALIVVAVILIIGLITFVLWKHCASNGIYKNLGLCTSRSPRVTDSAYRNYSES